jgi:hypothetical protein
MTGAELMRDAALLGAACVVSAPSDQGPDPVAALSTRVHDWAVLRARLDAHEASDDPARVRLCEELGLDRTAYCLVMLSCAVELHPEAAAAVSLLTEDPRAMLPTPTVVALLLAGMTGVEFGAALAAAVDGGAAGRLGIVEVVEAVPGLPHSHHALRLVGAELTALLDRPSEVGAHRERTIATLVPGAQPAFERAAVERAARLLRRHRVLVVRGPRRSGRQMACDNASVVGSSVSVVAGIPPALLSSRAGPLLVLVGETTEPLGAPSVDAPALGYPESLRVWTDVVGEARAPELAVRYRVGLEEARAAVRDAHDLGGDPPAGGGAVDTAAVAARVRAHGARRVGRHVAVVETSADLSDLVVPAALRAQLDEIVGWQRGSWRVRWGMDLGQEDRTGLGLTCLFAGKPGTGKTFAARCLAGELGLNLYRIDLSQVVSKYIGDTEKALATVFDEVEAGHGILLFDEADAIFGRRSEVKDAHDRYANIEVGYLLQRLETYEGMAVLTSNLQGNIDGAFVRRLRFILQFPEPDRELRRQLWERSLPGHQWRDGDLDLGVLADRFALNGGAIRNIGMAAAHLAAATPSGLVTSSHVLRATRRELQKTGRPWDAAAFGALPEPAVGNGSHR